MDNDTSDRPQSITALVANEFVRYSVDIDGLTEAMVAEASEPFESGACCTFSWFGHDPEERSEADGSWTTITPSKYVRRRSNHDKLRWEQVGTSWRPEKINREGLQIRRAHHVSNVKALLSRDITPL